MSVEPIKLRMFDRRLRAVGRWWIACVVEQFTLAGRGSTLASEVCADGLITPELVRELAASAKLVPLVHPADAPPEDGYVPSKALADFVRCRDLPLPLARLRPTGVRLRCGPYDPVRRRRAHACGQHQVLLPYASTIV